MKRPLIAASLLAALVLAGCGTTRFVSTWKEPSAGPGSLVGQKIATFVLSPQSATRRPAEDLLARELSARGAQGVAGYTLLPGDQVKDKDKAKKKLEEAGFAYVLVLQAVDVSEETDYVPGDTWYAPTYYRTWGGYWGRGWTAVHEPGYTTTSTVYTVESLLYRLADETMIWAGRSETRNPGNLQTFVSDYARPTTSCAKQACSNSRADRISNFQLRTRRS